jgi:hypothetical protein
MSTVCAFLFQEFPMAIKRVGLSWISISDRERAHSFFTKTLGLTIVEDHPEFGWMEIRGMQGGPVLGAGTAYKADCPNKKG